MPLEADLLLQGKAIVVDVKVDAIEMQNCLAGLALTSVNGLWEARKFFECTCSADCRPTNHSRGTPGAEIVNI